MENNFDKYNNFDDDDGRKEIRKFELEIPKERTLNISNYSGAMSFYTWDEERIEIIAEIIDKGVLIDSPSTVDIIINQDDNNGITIETKINKEKSSKHWNADRRFFESLFNWFGKQISYALSNSISYKILMPSDMNINAENNSGHYKINGFNSRVRLKTANGGIDADNLNGEIQLFTYNGKIYINNIKGELYSETYNGDIFIKESEIKNFTAKTMNGGIVSQFISFAGGEYNLKTMNGEIIIGIPKDSSIKLECKGISGKVINQFKTNEDNENNIFKMREPIILGQGDAVLNSSTMKGNTYIIEYSEFKDVDFEGDSIDNVKDKLNVYKLEREKAKKSRKFEDIKNEFEEIFNTIHKNIENIFIENKIKDELDDILDSFNEMKEKFKSILEKSLKESVNSVTEEDNEDLEKKVKNFQKIINQKINKSKKKIQNFNNKYAENIDAIAKSIDKIADDLKKFLNLDIHYKKESYYGDYENYNYEEEINNKDKSNKTKKERKKILKMLEKGKITVEEADKLLNEL